MIKSQHRKPAYLTKSLLNSNQIKFWILTEREAWGLITGFANNAIFGGNSQYKNKVM